MGLLNIQSAMFTSDSSLSFQLFIIKYSANLTYFNRNGNTIMRCILIKVIS